jgi:hypothetical protein
VRPEDRDFDVIVCAAPAQRRGKYERLGFRVPRIEHPRIKMEWDS